jgi:hypothetical protein
MVTVPQGNLVLSPVKPNPFSTVFKNYCKFISTTSGVGLFTVGSAAPTDEGGPHATPANCGAVSGATYKYYAQSPDGLVYEWGSGVFDLASNTLTRVTIVMNSDKNTSPVIFSVAPIVDVFPNPGKTLEGGGFGAGTALLFWQAAAPVGWTKSTTHDDKALRVVSGTGGGSGGSSPFSTVFGKTATDNMTLDTTKIPAHGHSYNFTWVQGTAGSNPTLQVPNMLPYEVYYTGSTTGNAGGGGSHQHGIDLRVYYLDLILCVKD